MARRVARALVCAGSLVGCLVLLRLAATDELAAPPLGSLDELGTWADDRGPVTSALGLVRFAAELAVWYLLGLTLVHALAGRRGAGGSGAWVNRLGPSTVTRVVRAGLGVGLMATSTTHASAAAVAGASARAAVVRPVAAGHPAQVADGALAEPSGTAPVERPPGHRPGSARMVPLPSDASVPGRPPPVPAQHRVEPGESFWTIAADVLEHHWGREPSDAEIDPFWRALVDANRHRLVTGDADLIVPGQVFEVPAPPPGPA